MNDYIYFEIQADDTKRAADFYKKIFGWKIERAEENLPLEYWRIETRPGAGQAGGNRGGLLKRPAKSHPPLSGTNAFVCSIEVENFDKTAEKINKAGGQVAFPKFAVPGVCWQGYFIDKEGNTFGIFQPDEKAK